MKGGRTGAGQRAAGSHTAALAGSTTAVEAVFRQAGVIEADTLQELSDVAVLLSRQPLPRGPRVAVLTNGGGLGILCADACEAAGLELPPPSEETRAALAALVPREASLANPIDMLGSATGATYEAAIPHLLADPGLRRPDRHLHAAGRRRRGGGRRRGRLGASRAARATTSRCSPPSSAPRARPQSLVDAGVATFDFPESAARALGHAAARAEWLRRPAGVFPELDGIDRATAEQLVASVLESSNDAWLTPPQVRTLLEAYGIPLVPERVADSVDAAIEAARELGFPVVVKTAAAGAHKTESRRDRPRPRHRGRRRARRSSGSAPRCSSSR